MNSLKKIHISRKIIGCIAAGVVLLGAVIGLQPLAKRAGAFAAANLERKLPIYCVQTEEAKVSVSFDAAWGADDTDELLRILEENDVKATFFLCGYWVEKYPEEVQKIAEAGHDLGNHSATHPHMSQLTAEQITEELQKCHQNVKDLTGIEMDLFRPPFGEYDNEVIETAKTNHYYTIQWDIDSLDWKEQGTDAEINQVLNHKHLGNGSIILFHNDLENTPAALDKILEHFSNEGYSFITASDLIYKENYTIRHDGTQCKIKDE